VIPDEAQGYHQNSSRGGFRNCEDGVGTTIAGRAELITGSIHDPVQLMWIDGFEQCWHGSRLTFHICLIGRPLLLGPESILEAHTDHERVRKSELMRAVNIYSKLCEA